MNNTEPYPSDDIISTLYSLDSLEIFELLYLAIKCSKDPINDYIPGEFLAHFFIFPEELNTLKNKKVSDIHRVAENRFLLGLKLKLTNAHKRIFFEAFSRLDVPSVRAMADYIGGAENVTTKTIAVALGSFSHRLRLQQEKIQSSQPLSEFLGWSTERVQSIFRDS